MMQTMASMFENPEHGPSAVPEYLITLLRSCQSMNRWASLTHSIKIDSNYDILGYPGRSEDDLDPQSQLQQFFYLGLIYHQIFDPKPQQGGELFELEDLKGSMVLDAETIEQRSQIFDVKLKRIYDLLPHPKDLNFETASDVPFDINENTGVARGGYQACLVLLNQAGRGPNLDSDDYDTVLYDGLPLLASLHDILFDAHGLEMLFDYRSFTNEHVRLMYTLVTYLLNPKIKDVDDILSYLNLASKVLNTQPSMKHIFDFMGDNPCVPKEMEKLYRVIRGTFPLPITLTSVDSNSRELRCLVGWMNYLQKKNQLDAMMRRIEHSSDRKERLVTLNTFIQSLAKHPDPEVNFSLRQLRILFPKELYSVPFKSKLRQKMQEALPKLRDSVTKDFIQRLMEDRDKSLIVSPTN